MIDSNNRWHVGKEVPLAVISTMVLQLAFVVWGASKLDSRITDHERRIDVMEKHEESARIPVAILGDRLARIEGQLFFLVSRYKGGDNGWNNDQSKP